tara:strand:+ start:922 stop:1464 length:543 start_codon:yes stop_codon:yes gene_type:complete
MIIKKVGGIDSGETRGAGGVGASNCAKVIDAFRYYGEIFMDAIFYTIAIPAAVGDRIHVHSSGTAVKVVKAFKAFTFLVMLTQVHSEETSASQLGLKEGDAVGTLADIGETVREDHGSPRQLTKKKRTIYKTIDGYVETMFQLDAKPELTVENNEGNTELYAAAKEGDVEIISELVTKKL